MKTRSRFNIKHITDYTGLTLGALAMAIPFIWMVLTSFKSFPETVKIPMTWLPSKFDFSNYIDVIERFNFGRYYLNTLIVAFFLTTGQIFMCSIAAYAFTRLRFPGRDIMFFIILSILMVPAQMTLIPRFLIVNQFGWVNTYMGLIVPSLPSAYGVFFLGQFLKGIPSEIEDSGKIDGCSIYRLFWSIVMPMCKNGIIAFGIIVVMWSWNELLWPLTVTNSEKMSVLSIGLATLNAMPGYASKFNILMAASVLITLPILAVFIIGQKKFISGIVISGLKT